MRASEIPAVTPERREEVDKAREIWIKKLIDLSRRNNLLFYRDLQTGTLDLSEAPDLRDGGLLDPCAKVGNKATPFVPDGATVGASSDLQPLDEQGLAIGGAARI
jgi:hypothetical protein